jgi:hypothetical protein
MPSVDVLSSLLKRRSFTAERRRSGRSPHVATARVSPPHATGYFAGYATTVSGVQLHIRNLSRGGVGFTCNQMLDRGKSYTMETGSNSMQSGSGLRVLWCRERAGGSGFEGGGEFC